MTPPMCIGTMLRHVRREIKTGRTRSSGGGRELTPAEMTALHKKRDALLRHQEAAAEAKRQKCIDSINDHTPLQVDHDSNSTSSQRQADPVIATNTGMVTDSEMRSGEGAVPKRKREDSLYVIQNTRIPGELKIGRSVNVTQRCNNLHRCQNFSVRVHAEFPGYGHLERQIHEALKAVQVQDVPGTEWFLCSPAVAIGIIANLIALSESQSPAPALTTPPVLTRQEMMEALAINGCVLDDEDSEEQSDEGEM